jgi:hypothetical protein
MNKNIYISKTTQSVKLTEQELKTAYSYWKKFYRFVSLDFELDPYLNERILPFQKRMEKLLFIQVFAKTIMESFQI